MWEKRSRDCPHYGISSSANYRNGIGSIIGYIGKCTIRTDGNFLWQEKTPNGRADNVCCRINNRDRTGTPIRYINKCPCLIDRNSMGATINGYRTNDSIRCRINHMNNIAPIGCHIKTRLGRIQNNPPRRTFQSDRCNGMRCRIDDRNRSICIGGVNTRPSSV